MKAYVVTTLSMLKMGKQRLVELRQPAQECLEPLDIKEISTHKLSKQPKSTHSIKYQAHTETTREVRSDVTQLPSHNSEG